MVEVPDLLTYSVKKAAVDNVYGTLTSETFSLLRMSGVSGYLGEKWPIRSILHSSIICNDHRTSLFIKKSREMSCLYKMTLKAANTQFYKKILFYEVLEDRKFHPFR